MQSFTLLLGDARKSSVPYCGIFLVPQAYQTSLTLSLHGSMLTMFEYQLRAELHVQQVMLKDGKET